MMTLVYYILKISKDSRYRMTSEKYIIFWLHEPEKIEWYKKTSNQKIGKKRINKEGHKY